MNAENVTRLPQKVYEKSLEHTHLELKALPTMETSSYEYKMLTNDIQGLLPLTLRRQNNELLYLYEVTGKITFSEYIKHTVYSMAHMEEVFLQILEICQSIQSFLLTEHNLLLHPEFIFIDTQTERPKVGCCYYVGYQMELREQLSGIMEFVMKYMDYEDRTFVSFLYEFYQMVREKTSTYDSWKQFLGKPMTFTSNVCEGGEGITKDKQVKERELPVVPERVEEEEEVLKYPAKSYIIAGITLLVVLGVGYISFRSGCFIDSRTLRYDQWKVIGGIVLATVLCGYVGMKVFDPKQKISCLQTKVSYVKCVKTDASVPVPIKEEQEKVQHMETDAYDNNNKMQEIPTVVLSLPIALFLIPLEQDRTPISILEAENTIGNLYSSANVQIPSPSVSRLHAKIEYRQESFYISDLSSTNGTFVNDERITEAKELKENDVIKFANVSYQVQIKPC